MASSFLPTLHKLKDKINRDLGYPALRDKLFSTND